MSNQEFSYGKLLFSFIHNVVLIIHNTGGFMPKFLFLLILVFSFTSCHDYVSNKRDGLKPYPDSERQAQEESEREQ